MVKGEDKEPEVPQVPVPGDIHRRIVRGKERMRRGASLRLLCLRFWRGHQYWYLDENQLLQVLPTQTTVNGGGKPRHRVRQVRNLIAPIVEEKVSRTTKRVPGYDIAPTSFDPARVAAASLAKKVALAGYDQWGIRRATKKLVTLAIVAGEGFAWPYYDTSIGPFAPDPDGDGNWLGRGDIRIRTYSRNQVMWEPGVEFDDSPWIATQEGRPVDEVMQLDDYMGGPLAPDAQAMVPQSEKNRWGQQLVVVTEYLERPSPKFPLGRWLTLAGNRVIVGATAGPDGAMIYRPYPLTDCDGNPVDEPVLHRLSYTVDPDADEDFGLVKHLIDPQRSYNDANNKALEWKNRVLNPRILAPVGSMKTRPDDQPGGIDYYTPVGGQVPQWQPVPPIPESLFQIMQQAKMDMQMIAATGDIPDDLNAGPAVEAVIERSHEISQQFTGDLAKVHSTIMRHCLYLAGKLYDTPRLMQVRGLIGWEPIAAFKGSDMMGECDVRVLPGSLVTQTREEVRATVMGYAQLGWVEPEQAMAAIESGTADQLIETFDLQRSRVWRVIQALKGGPDAFMNLPPHPDGTPGWMPRPFDNLRVQKKEFSDWLMTDDYEGQSAPVQEAANLYYKGILMLEQQEAAQAAQQQMQMAQGLGMSNAARPQLPPPTPSLPGSGAGTPPPK